MTELDRRTFLATPLVAGLSAPQSSEDFEAFTIPGVGRIPDKTIVGDYVLRWHDFLGRPLGDMMRDMAQKGYRHNSAQLLEPAFEGASTMYFFGNTSDCRCEWYIGSWPTEDFDRIRGQIEAAFPRE